MMNPPSALYGAMSKERKPFTYTPGGLDLSEIKSERMAKRLMRNAMSQGVPETPAQTLQSPPLVAPGVIPNFNCLPVQVFPTFQLPANPKSLLRTRSNPDGPKESSFIEKHNHSLQKEINKPLSHFSNNDNNNKPVLVNDNKINKSYMPMKTEPSNYGSYGHTDVFLPEKSYDVEYLQSEPQGLSKIIEKERILSDNKPSENKHNPFVYNSDIPMKTTYDIEVNPVALTSISSRDIATSNNDQKEVKIVQKQTKTETDAEQNGDTEAAVVVKLPSKSSAAKTETKVEVLKKILPDGTIEEIKKTTTKTTIDGKTEISTKTETRTIPKESAEVLEIEEQEEEDEEIVEENDLEEVNQESDNNEIKKENGEEVKEVTEDDVVSENNQIGVKENGNIITGEEKSETSTTKRVVVVQSTGEESDEEVEEEVEEEEESGDVDVEEVIVLKKPQLQESEKIENENETNVDEVEEEVEASIVIKANEENGDQEIVEDEDHEVDEEEIPPPIVQKDSESIEQGKEDDDVDEEEVQKETEEKTENLQKEHEEKEDEEEFEEAEDSEVKVEAHEKSPDTHVDDTAEITDTQADKTTEKAINIELEPAKDNKDEETETLEKESTEVTTVVKENTENEQIKDETLHKTSTHSESRVSFREPSIPFEKVEDIEIKPIGPAQEIIKKSHTEIITTTTDKPSGALSTQTEYNRIENIVTVNRTSKTLDHAYEQTQQQIPAIKTYVAPINDRILTTPQPIVRPYQPVYAPEPQTERRHSLLLDRLSVDRQVPISDVYQNNYSVNQSYEQNQWSEEPQSEVLTVSNVKPSTITKNQQWYQQTTKENVLSNTISPTPVLPSQLWSQKNQAQNQTQNQIPVQPTYQQTFTQQEYTPKQEYQPSYIEDSVQNTYSYKSNTDNVQSNVYPNYTPKPSWVSSTFDSKPTPSPLPNQYSSLTKESFQNSTQQFGSSYVPPPWEQDSSYVVDNQNYYQPPPSTVSYTPNTNQQPTWKPKPPPSKFSKPKPTSYIPPAPNQSFVKPVLAADTPKISGRKTYYSEYERRYISVPESTYVPNETKFSAQPDPSPQYYYDNNEPAESVEPQWRRELREFTEKTSQSTTQTEKTSIRPPWEEDPKYAATTEYTATVTPSWTQTLRPRSWRERSYEPEYIGSKEWPKTNTLGRGRPQSSYVRSNVDSIPERTRGVSVDRYNPNNYQSPSEHPPVQSHTLDPTIHPKTYHNPNVPAYHSRASAEPREQTTAYPQHRVRVDTRAPPVQSRSFKYLQWITGTED